MIRACGILGGEVDLVMARAERPLPPGPEDLVDAGERGGALPADAHVPTPLAGLLFGGGHNAAKDCRKLLEKKAEGFLVLLARHLFASISSLAIATAAAASFP